MAGGRRDAWVFLKGRSESSAVGAVVQIVERRARRRAGLNRDAGASYAWVVFPEIPHGAYTVRVTYPSGATQVGHLVVDRTRHQVTLEEPPAQSL